MQMNNIISVGKQLGINTVSRILVVCIPTSFQSTQLIVTFLQIDKIFDLYVLPQYARFMPMQDSTEIVMSEYFSLGELKYHSSFDWLLPVVDKIVGSNLKTRYNQAAECILTLENMPITTSIEAVYGVVIEFLTWYKTIKE